MGWIEQVEACTAWQRAESSWAGENSAEDCKKCIFHMMSQIVNWRKLHHSQDDGMAGVGMHDPSMMMMGLQSPGMGGDPNMMQYGNEMMMGGQMQQQQDFRPDTAAAIAAVQQQFAPEQSNDYRPDQQLHFKQSSSSQCRAWGVTWAISDQTQQLPLLLYSRRV